MRRPTRAGHALAGLLLALAAVGSVTGAVLVVRWRMTFVPVLSPSMDPAYAAGDLAVTRQTDTARIAPGQVLVLPLPDAPGQRFVHRVVEVRRTDGHTDVRTKGDANAAPDPWTLRITSDDVPRVVGRVDRAGYLPALLRGNGVRLALLAAVVVLCVTGVRRSFRGE